jgi:hypothetical protein
MLDNFARFVLWGNQPMGKKQLTLDSAIFSSAINVGRWFVGLQPTERGLMTFAQQFGIDLLGEFFGPTRAALPVGFPEKLFATVDEVIKYRGGLYDRETESPNFWADRGGCRDTPLMWVVPVNCSHTANPSTLANFEESLEDRLTRAGYDCNVRILYRPLRIEIDKPKPPAINLRDHWQAIAALPIDERLFSPGVIFGANGLEIKQLALVNDGFSNLVAGRGGAGKTQLALDIVLSLCYANSPERIGLLICDPKAIDWMPVNGLPHLAAPIATEPDECLALVAAVVEQMDNRTKRAKHGDTGFLKNTIVLYIDEIADLFASLSKAQADQLETYLQRLQQKGRGLGICLILATQRVYAVPKNAYALLNRRFVGQQNDASDSVAAAGRAGVQCHKLPGRGAFEVYPSGERIQGYFVADPDGRDYKKILLGYVTDIRNRWANRGPFWTVGNDATPPPAAPTPGPGPVEEPTTGRPKSEFDPGFLQAIRDLYNDKGAGMSYNDVRKLYQEKAGKQMKNDAAKRAIAEAFDYAHLE